MTLTVEMMSTLAPEDLDLLQELDRAIQEKGMDKPVQDEHGHTLPQEMCAWCGECTACHCTLCTGKIWD